MAVELTGKIAALGLGAVDEVLERQDAKAGRTEPLKTWRDYGRIGMVVVGVGTEMFMPRYRRLAETVGEVGVALAVKSLSHVLMPAGAAAPVTYVPHRQPAGATSSPGGTRRSYYPEAPQAVAW